MSYNKKTIWIVMGLIILFGGIWKFVHRNSEQQVIVLGECRFIIETPKTAEEMTLGLGNRDGLCQRCGMLFEFSKKERYKFWMKEMRFPIDIIWLADNKVVGVERNISEKSTEIFQPAVAINRVLEINGNEAMECGIK